MTLDSLTAVDDLLIVDLSWEPGSGALPANATLKVSTSDGDEVTSLTFVPQEGPQMIWIPGGLVSLPSDTAGAPLQRSLDLGTSSSERALFSVDLVRQAGLPLATVQIQRWCYLHLITLECVKTRNAGATDNIGMRVDEIPWGAVPLRDGQAVVLDRMYDFWFCLGPSPGEVYPETVDLGFLGTFTVDSQNPTAWPKVKHFTKGRAEYILTYEVRCLRYNRHPWLYPC